MPWGRDGMADVNLVTGNDGSDSLRASSGTDLIYGWNPNGPQGSVSTIPATRVASGLSQPLLVTSAPDNPNRLFIVEKGGLIKILDLDRRRGPADVSRRL